MLKNCASLLEANARKPLDELIDRGTVFEVFKECCNRHARPTKDPGAAIALGIVFDGVTGGPIDHPESIALAGSRLRLAYAVER